MANRGARDNEGRPEQRETHEVCERPSLYLNSPGSSFHPQVNGHVGPMHIRSAALTPTSTCHVNLDVNQSRQRAHQPPAPTRTLASHINAHIDQPRQRAHRPVARNTDSQCHVNTYIDLRVNPESMPSPHSPSVLFSHR